MPGIVPSYRAIARGAGENMFLYIAPVIRRVPPIVGAKHSMPWIIWQAYIPGQRIAIAWGRALSVKGAEGKAWKAYDRWVEGRRRWQDGDKEFTDGSLCRESTKDPE